MSGDACDVCDGDGGDPLNADETRSDVSLCHYAPKTSHYPRSDRDHCQNTSSVYHYQNASVLVRYRSSVFFLSRDYSSAFYAALSRGHGHWSVFSHGHIPFESVLSLCRGFCVQNRQNEIYGYRSCDLYQAAVSLYFLYYGFLNCRRMGHVCHW